MADSPGEQEARALESAENALAAYGLALAEATSATLSSWVQSCVATRMAEWTGVAGLSPEVAAAAAAAGREAATELGAELLALLAQDLKDQRTTPLALLRQAVRYPTAVLASAGVPEVQRDPFSERQFPADVYDLSPATFADVSQDLAEPGLLWGAAKAYVVLQRREREPKPAVAAFVPDLMDRSRFNVPGRQVTFVSAPSALAESGAALWLVDLSRPGVISSVAADAVPGVRIVGFASHVDDALMSRAAAAGIEALPRSVFFRRLRELLG